LTALLYPSLHVRMKMHTRETQRRLQCLAVSEDDVRKAGVGIATDDSCGEIMDQWITSPEGGRQEQESMERKLIRKDNKGNVRYTQR